VVRRLHVTLQETRAFSLVELVMVVAIIGMLAAIAVPRISQAAQSSKATALQASVSTVREAIDLYYAEHGRYPGYSPGSGTPDGDAFVSQLMHYSDEDGYTQKSPDTTFRFGPYMRPPFPKNPINGLQTVHVKAKPADAEPADGSVGWIAVLSHGYFGISAIEADLDELVGTLDNGSTVKNQVKGQPNLNGT